MAEQPLKQTKKPEGAKSSKRTIAEKMLVAEQLRDLQKALAPLRDANRTKRSVHKVTIRIKTR